MRFHFNGGSHRSNPPLELSPTHLRASTPTTGAMAFAEEQGLARSEGLVTPEALEENATDAATDAGRRTWATDVGDGRDGR